jgi:hypothetical protein
MVESREGPEQAVTTPSDRRLVACIVRSSLFLQDRERNRLPAALGPNGTAEEECYCLGGYDARPDAGRV